VAENDSFRVVYRFNGLRGPVQIGVVNKTNLPLLVDWSKSYFIKKGKYKPLYTPRQNRKYKKRTEEGFGLKISEIEKIIPRQKQEPVPFNGSLNKVSVNLFPKSFLKPGGHPKERKIIQVADYPRKIKKYVFNKDNSRYSFRLQLAVGVEGSFSPPAVLDHSFYISELVVTKVPPEHLPEHADKVMVQKPTITGAILVTTGTIVVGAIVLWLKYFVLPQEENP
jgi:hypothetical protein